MYFITTTSPTKVDAKIEAKLINPSKERKVEINKASMMLALTLHSNFDILVNDEVKCNLLSKPISILSLATLAWISMGLKSLVLWIEQTFLIMVKEFN